jgi:L-ribulose-5-phosphate 3-epimerase
VTTKTSVKVGMNGRFFPNNWRPVLDEVRFAHAAGFYALQLQGKELGLTEEHLGTSFVETKRALETANLTATMELLIRLQGDGRTQLGKTPLEVLEANLPAINGLPCQHVHWHLVPEAPLGEMTKQLERALLPNFEGAVKQGEQHGFTFAFEHNEPALDFFAAPHSCVATLKSVPGLRFVWDLNHTKPEHLSGFKALAARMSLLHVADTPLPEVNYHLPLGLGTVDFTDYAQPLLRAGFQGFAILEIGGLPKSGGFGRDTDHALIDSKNRLEQAFATAAC